MRGLTPMTDRQQAEVPQTLEGWYVLHDVYRIDWSRWRALADSERSTASEEAVRWAADAAGCERGDSAFYSIVSQKGDVMFVHYRETPDALGAVELGLRQLRLYDVLIPAYSYLSVIEVSLYEVTAIAAMRIAERGLERGTKEFDGAFEEELARQKERMSERLFRDVPPQRYVCFYPMSKRRGEHVNWYMLPLSERRAMMRSHGTIGHKYHEQVTQVIAGSVGLDDWEWGVSLHSDDPLVFKKLVYEMRFDPASALYAEFGPFYVGVRRSPEQLAELLVGRLV